MADIADLIVRPVVRPSVTISWLFSVWTLDKKQGGWSLYSTNRQVVE